jgi:hypothetical protein
MHKHDLQRLQTSAFNRSATHPDSIFMGKARRACKVLLLPVGG